MLCLEASSGAQTIVPQEIVAKRKDCVNAMAGWSQPGTGPVPTSVYRTARPVYVN